MSSQVSVFPVFYLPPISYFILLKQAGSTRLEIHENFIKSTGRNRAFICGPNGKLRLSIPIKGGKNKHSLYGQVQIDNEQKWQKIHWQSLCSAYRRSPYFEFYEDAFYPFFHLEFNNLLAYNLELFGLINKLLEWGESYVYTGKYHLPDKYKCDYRSRLFTSDKHLNNEPLIKLPTYHQVFQDRNGFIPNLSIVDLLFNAGPNAGAMIDSRRSKGS